MPTIITYIQQIVAATHGWISTALNGNPLIAGAATASIIASLAYVARRIPKQIWYYVKRHIVFTYYIEYDYDGNRTMIQTIAEKFEYQLQKRVSGHRAGARLTTRKKRLTETLADGGFFFQYKGAWIWASRKQEQQNKDNSKATRRLVTLSLTALRFHRAKILDILSDSAKEYMVPGIYQIKALSWGNEPPDAIRHRNFTTLPVLAIDQTVKEEIDTAIDNFLKNRERNNEQDIPHKLVFMLHGEPGTGKSALGEYIAFRLKTSLFVFNGLSNHDSRVPTLSDVVRAARNNITEGEVPVVLADDFDAFLHGLHKRDTKKKKNNEDDSEVPTGWIELEESPALGKMLAALQSPVEITDCVIIFTTNHLEKIDPAMYRPGRVTKLIEIGRMSPRSIMEYFEQVYGRKWPEHVLIDRAIRACDVSSYRMANEDNPRGFVTAVLSQSPANDEVFNNKEITVVA